MSEFKEGDFVVLIKTGTKEFLLQIVNQTYTNDMYRVNILSNGQYGPIFKDEMRLATIEEIAAGHRIDNDMGDDSHIENHISPLCKSKDV